MSLAERISSARKAAKMSQNDLAEALRVHQTAVSLWERGKNEPDLSTIAKIAKVLGIKVSDLVEQASKILDVVIPQLDPIQPNQFSHMMKEKNGFITLPMLNVTASAGDGSFVDGETEMQTIHFNAAWLQHSLRVRPEHLRVITAAGDSMDPTIRDGDLLLIDTRTVDMVADGVYVVVVRGRTMVKRLQLLPNGGVRVKSDNTQYDPFDLGPDTPPEEFRICGRLMWLVRGSEVVDN